MNETTMRGTMLKMRVGFDYPADPDITLDSIDFHVEFLCSSYSVLRIEKSEMVKEGDDWYAFVDTGKVGPGRMKMRLCAFIPDAAVDGGIRKEIASIDTFLTIG